MNKYLAAFGLLTLTTFGTVRADSNCQIGMKYSGQIQVNLIGIGTQPSSLNFTIEGALDPNVDYPESGVTLTDSRNQIGLRVAFDAGSSRGFTYGLIKRDSQSEVSLNHTNSVMLNPVFPFTGVELDHQTCPLVIQFEKLVLRGGSGQQIILSGKVDLIQ